jgi:hypothetical protein
MTPQEWHRKMQEAIEREDFQAAIMARVERDAATAAADAADHSRTEWSDDVQAH